LEPVPARPRRNRAPPARLLIRATRLFRAAVNKRSSNRSNAKRSAIKQERLQPFLSIVHFVEGFSVNSFIRPAVF
jgi:hypothetical protein